MMRGCDKYMVYSYTKSIKMNQEKLEAAINGSCDLLPASSLPTMPNNFSQDMTCIAGDGVFGNYLYNDSATQENLCEVFTKMSECVLANSSAVALPWRKALETISHIVKKQVYFRCSIVGKLDSYKKDITNRKCIANASWILKRIIFCKIEWICISVDIIFKSLVLLD